MTENNDNVFVHPQGICESKQIGPRSRVWAFAHILSGAVIGEDANICDHTFIENDVKIGDRVTIKSFVAVWDGIRIEDDVFIGPSVSFANDKYPRSKKYLQKYPITFIRKGASIGNGAVILPGVEIGEYAMVGAGSVVSKNIAPFALVKGQPAKQCAQVCKCGGSLLQSGDQIKCSVGDWIGTEPSPDMTCNE